MKHFLLLTLLSFSLSLLSQGKLKIDHTIYDDWNYLSSVQQSESGDLISYTINPSVGDGKLFFEKVDGSFKKTIHRGNKAHIHFKEEFVVCQIRPYHDTIRQLKLDEVKKDKHPKDSLLVYWLKSDSSRYFENVKSYQSSEKGDWLAILTTEDDQVGHTCKPKKRKKCKKCPEKIKTSGKTLIVYNPITGSEKSIDRVTDYALNRQGTHLIYTLSEKGDKDSLDAHILKLSDLSSTLLAEKQLMIKSISFDYHGKQAAFLATADTNKKKNPDLRYWSLADNKSTVLVDSMSSGMPDNWTVSAFGSVYFSRDGKKLYFGTNEIVRQDPKDTLLDNEKAKVDVWSGFDPLIQPNQLSNLGRDKEKSYLAVYHLDKKKFSQIANEKVESIRLGQRANIGVALGFDSNPYKKERTWTYPWRTDVYLVDLESGFKQPLVKGIWNQGSLSPSGEYYCWFNPEDSCWYGKHVNDREIINLTKDIDENFVSDNNGQPSLSWSQGAAGWTNLAGHEYYIVNTEWDVLAISPANPNKVIPITLNGKKDSVQNRLWRVFDNDSLYVDLSRVLVKTRDDKTKDEGLMEYRVDEETTAVMNRPLTQTNHKIVYISKAEKSDKILFRKQSFTQYPELETTNLDFKEFKQVTTTNPNQSDYNWGTVEFVEWKSYEGIPLRGLLYKPEDFDPNKSYPLMVYFYEMYQNSFHSYYAPKATASIIYPTEYASNGYIVFIPDVRYTPGHPAKSAYDCILSGTDYLTDKYDWIDTNRMALQGQSWGGYQTAILVTMTNKYRAAMAGAPVSNMFSAYGGIRWGSGLSRMFQYERTQSRIGYTIWEKPELYIENSPVFHLPNVETPLLIMHNDKDGAVPWYQGIEMFMGLRRLDKDVWMLNYNGDAHNLTRLANKKDLSIRMRQFFDHYLLGEPMPSWMKDGVPALDKGIDYGLDAEK